MEEEKAKVRAVLRKIFPDVVVDDALVSTIYVLLMEQYCVAAVGQG